MSQLRGLIWCIGVWLATVSNAAADVPVSARPEALDPEVLSSVSRFLLGIEIPALPAGNAAALDSDAEVDPPGLPGGEPQGLQGDRAAPRRTYAAYVASGCLYVIGADASTPVALRLQAGAPAVLEVDAEDNGTADFSFDRATFNRIIVDARGGDDAIRIDELNGVFTDTESTTLYGGAGNDTLLGGSGGETFDGGSGNDSIFLGAGDDTCRWTPAGDADLIEDAAGNDTVEINGSDFAENFTVTANGTRVRFDRLDPSPPSLDIGACEQLVLRANRGNDTFACTGNLAALIHITADGGGGHDTLLGSNGADVLIGGNGDDFIDGQQGNDLALLGIGDDTFQWDPGDGSDTIEGQAGHDTVLFNGSNASEIFDFSANGQRLRFLRNIGNIIIDANDVEQFDLRALGGSDIANVSDLAGTALTEVNVDLAGTLAGGSGDASDDLVNILGAAGADVFTVSADNPFVVVDRAADVRVRGYEFNDEIGFIGIGGDVVHVNGAEGPDTITVVANGTEARVDATNFSTAVAVSGALSLVINGQGGPDMVSCTGNLAALVPITIDGGGGDDTLLGSNGADLLIGGDGNDLVDGQQGADLVLLGADNDTFQWDPGDGSDTIEGQDGEDTLVFNGSNAAEAFEFLPNGQRIRFIRNIGSIVMDVNSIERCDLRALGGADVVTVNDMTGTALTQVTVALAGTLGGGSGDAQPDSVVVNATNGADNVTVVNGFTGPLVLGTSATVSITTAEVALDRLTINALGGDDTVQATGLPSGVIPLTLNGGLGDDALVGSAGDDVLNGDDDNDAISGGSGADTVQLGAGNDHFVWNPGDGTDFVEGGDGSDTVEVNGGNGAEDFTVTANGTRVRFDRLNPAQFALDIGTCEHLVLSANGGNDTLACTGNLAALLRITADGGPGSDTLLGSNGPDLLLGGDDSDFIDGNQGSDVVLMGPGDDTFRWDPGDGSDTVEGQDGHDVLSFNGSNIGEVFAFSANGQRLRFTRNVGNIVMDADGLEQFDLQALGGADSLTVNDLTWTAVAEVNITLAGTLGGSSGDAQPDIVTVNGTELPDTIHIAANTSLVEVGGLAAFVRIAHSEAANDSLIVNGLGGLDEITADPGVTALIALTINQ